MSSSGDKKVPCQVCDNVHVELDCGQILYLEYKVNGI
jgi:hypothetical protein